MPKYMLESADHPQTYAGTRYGYTKPFVGFGLAYEHEDLAAAEWARDGFAACGVAVLLVRVGDQANEGGSTPNGCQRM